MNTMEVKTVCGNCGEVAVQAIEEKGMDSRPQDNGMAQDALPDDANFVDKRKKAKKRRIHRLTNDQDAVIREVTLEASKSLEEDDLFLCGLDRKVLSTASGACSNCPGGCCNEKGLPTLIEVEGLAEDDIGGEVIDSGYGAKADLFVVQVKRLDGKTVEAFYDGKSAELQGWALLTETEVPSEGTITPEEAGTIAVKSIEGEIVSVDPDDFEGSDAWAVEVNGSDGKSYDVFVSLAGDVLGFDDYGLISDVKSEEEVEVKTDVPEEEELEDDEDDEDEEVEEKSTEPTAADEDLLRALEELKSL